jgi:rare lipoprotein A
MRGQTRPGAGNAESHIVFVHQVLTPVRLAPSGAAVLHLVECRHYPATRVKVALVGIDGDGSPVFRLVHGDYCVAAAHRGPPWPGLDGDGNPEPTLKPRIQLPGGQLDLLRSVETGMASWYGAAFHGHAAASGEVYDMEQLTAAHRTLPFGTRVRVRRLDNDRTVTVRVNDRGPFFGDRIIDLSYAAARELGMTAPGTAQVVLDVLDAQPAGVRAARFAVLTGVFPNRDSAREACETFTHRYGIAQVTVPRRSTDAWAVLVGQFSSEAEASALGNIIKARDRTNGLVVRVDVPQDFPQCTGTL